MLLNNYKKNSINWQIILVVKQYNNYIIKMLNKIIKFRNYLNNHNNFN